MGLALGACSDGDEELATVATLIAGVQALWLRSLEIDDVDLDAPRPGGRSGSSSGPRSDDVGGAAA